MTRPKNAFYAQSGGVTAVINVSACGVIEGIRGNSKHFGTLYAGKNGILGALQEELYDTSTISDSELTALRYTPSGAFGSCRYKLKSLEENRREYERLIEVFKAHDIGYFFYNGGGDSQDTALKVSQLSKEMGYPISCIGIPKTIDNDLPHTDACPGYGSVAKYIAVSIREAAFDLKSMAKTSTKVFILECMGRHTGWIAAGGGLAKVKESDSPHMILFPEVTFNEKAFCQRVKECVEHYGYCTVVASEGVKGPDGHFLSEQGTFDAFGHSQLGGVAPYLANIVKEKLGYKYHWAVSDYLQRAARHIASATDVEQALALGLTAVELAKVGKTDIMLTIERTQDEPYCWDIADTHLSNVANVERHLPAEFIAKDGFNITPACRAHLEPLIMGESYPPYKRGLPDYLDLELSLIDKKLPPFELKI